MTNGDRVRKMDDVALAVFSEDGSCAHCARLNKPSCDFDYCLDGVIEWLETEVEE